MQNEPLIRESVSQSSATIPHDCSLSPELKSWVTCAVLLPYLRQMYTSALTSCTFLEMSEQILECRYARGKKKQSHNAQLLTNSADKREPELKRCLKYIHISLVKAGTLHFLPRMASCNCLHSHVTYVFR